MPLSQAHRSRTFREREAARQARDGRLPEGATELADGSLRALPGFVVQDGDIVPMPQDLLDERLTDGEGNLVPIPDYEAKRLAREGFKTRTPEELARVKPLSPQQRLDEVHA